MLHASDSAVPEHQPSYRDRHVTDQYGANASAVLQLVEGPQPRAHGPQRIATDGDARRGGAAAIGPNALRLCAVASLAWPCVVIGHCRGVPPSGVS